MDINRFFDRSQVLSLLIYRYIDLKTDNLVNTSKIVYKILAHKKKNCKKIFWRSII